VRPATRTPPSAVVASSVGAARENARPLSRRNREASAAASRPVNRTFVRIVSPSTTTRRGLRSTGAVR